MTTASERHTNNIVIGSGEVFIDLIKDGEYTGERYLGDSASAALSVATERIQVFSGDGPTAQKLVDSVRQITHSFALTVRDVSAENLALFVAGDTSQRAQAATAVTDETFQVRRGRWYQLGAPSATSPGGVTAIAETGFAVSVGDDVAGAVAATAIAATDADANYAVDYARGRFQILPDAPDIADGKYVAVDYTPAARDLAEVKVGAASAIEGAFRYIESVAIPGRGKGRNFYARLCSIGGGGEFALKSRDGEQQIALTAEVQEPTDGWPRLLIDGVA